MTKLPKTWEVKTLADCLEYEQPTKYIVKNTSYSDEYEIPVLTAGKSFILGYTNETENIFTKTPVIIFDDFMTDSKFVDFDFKVKSSAMKILNPTKIANIKFVFYFMQTIQHRSDTHKRYWISEYSKLKIPLPPLDTQKQIVELLDFKFAKIENATNALNLVKKDLVKLKASLLNSAFNGTLLQGNGLLRASPRNDTFSSVIASNEVAKQSTNNTESTLPHLPQDWEVKTLGEVCEIVTGSTPSKKNAEYYGNDYPFYKPTDLNNGYFVDSALDNISLKGYEISRQLQSGSVLVTCIGATIGKTGLIRKEGICNQQINAILPSDNFLPEFMYFYCISPKFQELIKTNASSTTLPILNKNNFAKLPIPIPPIETQKQIVELLEAKFKSIEKLEHFANDSLDKLNKLKASLLNKAFSGELVC
ncbi:hypothetical protein BKN38_02945 [Helicobacter sp. CLO-3]|uniref:restriction endonuclease subunit S n=1 Tax=unclassified Helicobacter TaxID=2593540 RepID=UPI0008050DBB|nr:MULTISPECIES: restriction endonuclease subunit S [unclassified Helicobacter]OBV29569.1 hypothetical protein BA723_05115 [Helicobacter sp. CLO-3]OHU84556.1 hypothetical protein BKN38_02945 [Helicobacter sp. CLO-3]